MHTLRIILTAPNHWKPFSEIIKWRLGTKYSHAAIVNFDREFETYDVYQASKGQVHEIDFEIFKEKNDIFKVYYLELTEAQYKRSVLWLKKQRGKGYSEAGAIASTVPFLRKLGFGKDGDKEFICSEYVFRFLEEAFNKDLMAAGRGDDDYIDPLVLEGVLDKLQGIQTNSHFVGHSDGSRH